MCLYPQHVYIGVFHLSYFLPSRRFSTWLNVWTLNGDLLVSKKTSNNMGELITACIMTRGAEWIDAHNVIVTGHANGAIKVCVWCLSCVVWCVVFCCVCCMRSITCNVCLVFVL